MVSVNVGETGRTLKVRIYGHKQAVQRGDMNIIAVHEKNKDHTINLETTETGYWKRRVQEAIRIQKQPKPMNFNCGPTIYE